MAAAFVASVVMSSVTRVLVVSSLTGLLIELTTATTSVTGTHLTEDTNNSNIDYLDNSFIDSETDRNTTTRPVSDEERQRYLDYLQRETTKTMLLAMTFLVCVAAVGITGNSLVIIVYWRKHHWSATETLIVTIAMTDIITNIIAIPGEIYSMLHQWDFNNETICRIRRNISAITVISSGIILVAVAVTRYRKVCYPYQWQITKRNAKCITICVYTFATLFTIPYTIIQGSRTKKTPRSDIVGHKCTISDKYAKTLFPLFMYVFFFLLYLTCSVSLTVLYTLIGVKAWRHRKIHGGSPCTSMATSHGPVSSQITSSAKERSLNQNESNCTACISRYNNNVVDTSITREGAIQSTSHVDDIMKWIGVGTTMVREIFVKLPKTWIIHPAIHEESHYNNTDDEHKSQLASGSGEGTSKGGIRIIERNASNGGWKPMKFRLVEIETNWKYTECRSENAWSSNKTTGSVNTYHSKECSDKYGSIYYNIYLNLYNGINNNRHFPQSKQSAVNKVLNESDLVSIIKRLGVISCLDEEHNTFDSNCVERETNISVQLPFNNNLLQQAEWMRTSGVDAMETQDEPPPAEGADNSPVRGSTGGDRSHQRRSSTDSDGASTITSMFSLQNMTARSRETMLRTAFKLSSASRRYLPGRRHFGRTTVMLFIISIIYICGYLPHLVISFVKLLSPDRLENLSTVKAMFLQLLTRTFYLNSAVNPIIYSLCDSNFRRASFKMFKCQ